MNQTIRNLLLLFPAGGIKWLLRDEFTDTRAAGAVNGTPATPGPGTRDVVIDTDGDALSIAGGSLVFANPNGAYGDPGIWYGAMTRTAGRVLLSKVNCSVIRTGAVGFDGDQTGAASSSRLHFNTKPSILADKVVTIAAWTTDIDYMCVVVLRGTGAYYLIKGGAFATWTLLWVRATDNTATLYPCWVPYNFEAVIDYFRIPVALWLPTPLAYDSFTRANGAIGISETVGPDGQATPARTWNNRVGTTLVASNKAQASVLDGGVAIATVNTGTVNAITGATLTRAGNEVGVVLRYADADNYIRTIHDGTNCKLIKRVAAAETDVISAVVALGAGAIRVIPDGTSFALYLNDAQVGTTSTISDAALQTGTEQGLYSTNLGNTQDGFTVFARGSNGEYAALNKWSF